MNDEATERVDGQLLAVGGTDSCRYGGTSFFIHGLIAAHPRRFLALFSTSRRTKPC